MIFEFSSFEGFLVVIDLVFLVGDGKAGYSYIQKFGTFVTAYFVEFFIGEFFIVELFFIELFRIHSRLC